jgi:UDP-2,3-diacylglucosamine pyrophosphatase LpxH
MPESRTLVVSDLHLHVGSDPAVAADFVRLLDGRPADLLVINGELFDLDRVAGEKRAGIGSRSAVARVARILDEFPQVTASLHGWLVRGGRIVWLPGNHDAEICLPAVQQELLRRLGPAGDRLRFEYDAYSENGVHIEHGHQHDPDNRFHPTTAGAVSKQRLSAMPLGCLTTRFLLCRIPAYQNSADNHKGPLSVLLRVLRNHRWATPGMVFLYFIAGLRTAFHALLARRRRDAPPESSMAGPFKIIRRMYLDRVALAFVLATLLVLGFVPGPDPAVLGTGAPLAAILLVPPSRKRRYRFRDRLGCQLAAGERIRRGARVVIMGHTHYQEGRADGKGVYLNPGAFSVPTESGRPYVVLEGTTARLDYLPLDG